jgi:hypothetical protein
VSQFRGKRNLQCAEFLAALVGEQAQKCETPDELPKETFSRKSYRDYPFQSHIWSIHRYANIFLNFL